MTTCDTVWCRDLGFGDDDRRENIRRVGEVARLMVDVGLIALTAFIPHRAERQLVRDMRPAGHFIEVFGDTPLAVCEAPPRPDLHPDGKQLVTNLTGRLLDLLDECVIIES